MRRFIDGKYYECIDVGCPDFEAAARNRRMIDGNDKIIGYQFIEAFVRAWPRNKPLPEWIPLGKLPTINKSERENVNSYGIYEIGNDGLIKVDRVYEQD